jgi:hypothetical protein
MAARLAILEKSTMDSDQPRCLSEGLQPFLLPHCGAFGEANQGFGVEVVTEGRCVGGRFGRGVEGSIGG